MPELAVCAASSLLGLHLTGSSFPVGYVDWLKLFPMTFGEFVKASAPARLSQVLDAKVDFRTMPDSAHVPLWDLWKQYLVTGGLPEVVLRYTDHKLASVEAFADVRVIQKKIITAYLADVAKHSGKVNAMHIERTWRAIPSQLARAHDTSVNRFKFKDVVPGSTILADSSVRSTGFI